MPELTAYTRGLNQGAVYWAPLGNDGFGGVLFDVPVEIRCRWQDVNTLVRNAEGQEVTSTTTVYPDRALLPQGYLYLGNVGDTLDSAEFVDPREVPGAREIITVGASPSLSATHQLNKANL